ncbi:MAG: hypothetical protein AAFQ42_00690 [Pseudomonadota bacterium]
MAKIVMVFFAGIALIQVIRPLGWPGLERRQDAWKLAVAGAVIGVAMVMLATGLRDA